MVPAFSFISVLVHADLQFLVLDLEFNLLFSGLHLLEQDVVYVSIPTFFYTCLTFCARYFNTDGLRGYASLTGPKSEHSHGSFGSPLSASSRTLRLRHDFQVAVKALARELHFGPASQDDSRLDGLGLTVLRAAQGTS